MEIIRTISGVKDSVPASVVTTSGTFTGSGRRLAYAGADDLRLTFNKYGNIWLFFPTAGLLVKVQSYGKNVVYLPSSYNITLSAETGQVVEGCLVYYNLTNVGAGAATVDGQSLNAGFPVTSPVTEQLRAVPKILDPVLVDATNSDVRVIEQR